MGLDGQSSTFRVRCIISLIFQIPIIGGWIVVGVVCLPDQESPVIEASSNTVMTLSKKHSEALRPVNQQPHLEVILIPSDKSMVARLADKLMNQEDKNNERVCLPPRVEYNHMQH